MVAPDLDGPFDDFIERMTDIRRIVCAIESSYRTPGALTTARLGVDLTTIGPTTSNNVNSMAVVFLASSYEEFIREEISECASYLCTKYATLPDQIRHSVRNSYWSTTLQRLGFNRNILSKDMPKVPDAAILMKVRLLLDAAQVFVVSDDASRLDASTAVHHSNNFRPKVVDEIAARVGIPNLTARTAEGPKIRTHFSVATSAAAAKLLRMKLDEFYDRRNEIVHSLNSTTGYGVDIILEWIVLFELVAESMKNTLTRATATW